MNQFTNNSLKVFLVIFVVQCYSRRNQECDSSDQSHCDSVNEVTHESSLEQADNNSVIRRRYNLLKENAEKAEEYMISSETVTEAVSIEDVTCGYQYNSSKEEDEDDSKSTLIDYPFSVSIQKKGAHYVSGALVNKRWILSVAGEFFHVRDFLKLFRARLGSVDCKKGGTVVPIKKIEIHPYYIYGKPNFDISLLRIAIPVDYSEVLKPIGISYNKGKVLNAKFITTYWPRIVLNGKTISEKAKERTKYNSMRVSTQKIIPANLCKSAMTAAKQYIHDSCLCLEPVVKHHSVCMPDAGAPVVAEDVLWGITSGWISPTCPNFPAPTVFTQLSSPSVWSWLDTQLQVKP